MRGLSASTSGTAEIAVGGPQRFVRLPALTRRWEAFVRSRIHSPGRMPRRAGCPACSSSQKRTAGARQARPGRDRRGGRRLEAEDSLPRCRRCSERRPQASSWHHFEPIRSQAEVIMGTRQLVGLPLPSSTSRKQRRRDGSLTLRGESWWGQLSAESFFATIKRELIDRRPWPTIARSATGGLRLGRRLVTRRLHCSLSYLIRSPHPPKPQQPSGIINSTHLFVRARHLHPTGC